MARKWLYFPFTDISQDETMPTNQQRYQTKYGANLQVKMKGDSLAGVGDDEMLIIAGHGLPSLGSIGVSIDKGVSILGKQIVAPTQISITGNDLAGELAAANLPQTHKYIKLITCGGSGIVAVDDAKATLSADKSKVTGVAVVRHDHAAGCLAAVLAAALGQRLYHHIMVKGYPGFIDANGAQKTVSVEGTSEFSQTKTTLGSWFTGATQFGVDYWKDGKVGLVTVPSKLVNDYWYDKNGQLVRQHIKL